MLSPEDNELLTRVEKHAPMGAFLRENFWFPAGLSQTITPDGAPLRVPELADGAAREVVVWGARCAALDCGAEAAGAECLKPNINKRL